MFQLLPVTYIQGLKDGVQDQDKQGTLTQAQNEASLISSQEAEKLHLEIALSLKILVYGDVSNFP